MATQKLNQMNRDAFINGVLNDTPKVDYDVLAHKLIIDHCEATMNPKVKAVYDDPSLKDLLRAEYCSMYGTGLASLYVAGYPKDKFEKVKLSLDKKLKVLGDKAANQKTERDALKAKLRELINSVATVQQAHKQLPEFTKYLPADMPKATENLPAVIVGDTVKLLKKSGWPKDGKVSK
jgi:Nucleotide modification associated domain 5